MRERFGEHLLEHPVPLRRLLDAGLHVGCGTDWGPKNVFEHLALAVEPRYCASGERAPQPGISRSEALAMWTRDAAHVLRWERIGSLVPGYHADLIVVDRNPLECPIEDLPAHKCLRPCSAARPCTASCDEARRLGVSVENLFEDRDRRISLVGDRREVLPLNLNAHQ